MKTQLQFILEKIVDHGIRFVVSFFINLCILPLVLDVHASFRQAFGLALFFTLVGIIEQVYVRKLLLYWNKKKVETTETDAPL